MSQGVGYEQFTCPNCQGPLFEPGLGCLSCGYGRAHSRGRAEEASPSAPLYSGGDAVLKARLRQEEFARKKRRPLLPSEGIKMYRAQENAIREALARAGGDK